MTDKKEIIIDGVDVSKCEWFGKIDLDINIICTSNSPKKCSGYCKDNPNCFYKRTIKQLKAKEQECERLNEYSVGFARKCQKLELDACRLKDKNYNLQRRLDQLKQTLTEIKEIAENMNKECFYDDFDCKDCDMKNGCIFLSKLEILQKISEVKND